MSGLLRPRAAVLLPLCAALCAAALLLLVAFSILAGPPDDGAADSGGPILQLVRAICFTAAGIALFTALAGFARRHTQSTPAPATLRQAPPRAGSAAKVPTGRVSFSGEQPGYTLIAVDSVTGQPAAISDFASPVLLLEGMDLWRQRHPLENLIVYAADGQEIARRACLSPVRDRPLQAERVPAAAGGRV